MVKIGEKGSFGPLKGIMAFLFFIFLALFAWKMYPFLVNLMDTVNTISTSTTVGIYVLIGIIVTLLFTVVYLPFSVLFLEGKPNLLGAIAVPIMFIVMAAVVTFMYPIMDFMINLFGSTQDVLLLVIFVNFILLVLLYGVPIGFYFYLEERMKW